MFRMSQDPSRNILGTEEFRTCGKYLENYATLFYGYFALKFDEEQSLITKTTEKLDFY